MPNQLHYHAHCDGMIPAERCIVLIYPAMSARRAAIAAQDLQNVLWAEMERLGIDEFPCGWEGLVPMAEGADARGSYMEADCPRCAQPIRLYDGAR